MTDVDRDEALRMLDEEIQGIADRRLEGADLRSPPFPPVRAFIIGQLADMLLQLDMGKKIEEIGRSELPTLMYYLLSSNADREHARKTAGLAIEMILHSGKPEALVCESIMRLLRHIASIEIYTAGALPQRQDALREVYAFGLWSLVLGRLRAARSKEDPPPA